QPPEAVVATGGKHVNGVEDVAFITIYFSDKVIAHLNVNWLSPVKVRTTLIGGGKKMLVWNDLETDQKIKGYDQGVEITNGNGNGNGTGNGGYDLRVSYRAGDLWSPRVEQVEALKVETQYFADCVIGNERPLNDGLAGLRIVRMLEAVDESLAKKGKM